MLEAASEGSATVSSGFLIREGHKLIKKCIKTDDDKRLWAK